MVFIRYSHISLLAGLLFVLFQATISMALAQEVEVSGSAPLYDDLTVSKEEAKRDALRAAVEKAIGQYLDDSAGSSTAKQLDTLDPAAGYIETFTVLDEYEQDGRYVVEVRASVIVDAAIQDIIKNAKSLCVVQQYYHQPRVMVTFDERIFGKKSDMPISEIHATEYLENICLNTVDKAALSSIQGSEIFKSMIYDDDVDFNDFDKMDDNKLKPLMNALMEEGVEWVLKGYAEVEDDACTEESVYGSELTSCRASVRIKMIHVKSGQVLAPIVVNQSHASPGASKKAVAMDAIYDATSMALESALVKIVDNWKIGGGPGTCSEIVVTIYGASSIQFKTIRTHIESIAEQDLCSVNTLNFIADSIAKMSVSAKFTGEELFDYLMEDPVPDIAYDVVNFTPSSLEIKIRN